MAVEVPDLYVAKIPVESQRAADRTKALKAAMQAVLIKVGGHGDVIKAPEIKAALRNHKNFYTTYRYSRKDGQNHLVVSFDEKKINQLFIKANLPLWGSLRPQILVWLVQEQQFDRKVLSNSENSELPKQISQFSEQRGLPMILPLMDLNDVLQVNLTDMWGRFVTPIEQASMRYAPDMVAIIRLSDNSLVNSTIDSETEDTQGLQNEDTGELIGNQIQKQQVALDWQLILDGKVLTPVIDNAFTEDNSSSLSYQYNNELAQSSGLNTAKTNDELITEPEEVKFELSRVAGEFSNKFKDISYQGEDYQALLSLALEDITKVVYQRYALSSDLAQDYIIDVSNVDSLATFKAVSEFLNELSSVRSVSLHQVKGQHKRFALELIGSEAAFLASLKLHKGLTKYVDPYAAKDPSAVPVFVWNAQ